MGEVQYSSKAAEDPARLWIYGAHVWSELLADAFYRKLVSTIHLIATEPGIGRSYEHIKPQLRGFPSFGYVVFYIPKGQRSILVVRILHASMDPDFQTFRS